MKKKWGVLLVVGMVCFSGLYARCEQPGQCPEFDKFQQCYGVATAGKLGQKIAACKNNPKCAQAISELQDDFNGMIEELPDVWIKGSNIRRIINAERLSNCINEHNLDLLGVAPKCLEEIGGRWWVFAEHIESGDDIKISLKLIQQLVVLAEQTGYMDWRNPQTNENNWLWDVVQHKLVCIDTENQSFLRGNLRKISLPEYCLFNYVYSLLVWYYYMEPAAQQWLYEYLNKLAKIPAALAPVKTIDIPLPWNTKYDNADSIDFEKVKTEYFFSKKSKNSFLNG